MLQFVLDVQSAEDAVEPASFFGVDDHVVCVEVEVNFQLVFLAFRAPDLAFKQHQQLYRGQDCGHLLWRCSIKLFDSSNFSFI